MTWNDKEQILFVADDHGQIAGYSLAAVVSYMAQAKKDLRNDPEHIFDYASIRLEEITRKFIAKAHDESICSMQVINDSAINPDGPFGGGAILTASFDKGVKVFDKGGTQLGELLQTPSNLQMRSPDWNLPIDVHELERKEKEKVDTVLETFIRAETEVSRIKRLIFPSLPLSLSLPLSKSNQHPGKADVNVRGTEDVALTEAEKVEANKKGSHVIDRELAKIKEDYEEAHAQVQPDPLLDKKYLSYEAKELLRSRGLRGKTVVISKRAEGLRDELIGLFDEEGAQRKK